LIKFDFGFGAQPYADDGQIYVSYEATAVDSSIAQATAYID